MALCQLFIEKSQVTHPEKGRELVSGCVMAQLDSVLAVSPSAEKAETLRCTWQDANFPSSKLVLFYCILPLPICVPKPVLSASGSVTAVIS